MLQRILSSRPSGQESGYSFYSCISAAIERIVRCASTAFSYLSSFNSAEGSQNFLDLSEREISFSDKQKEPLEEILSEQSKEVGGPFSETELSLIASCQEAMGIDLLEYLPEKVKNLLIKDRTEILKALSILSQSFQEKETNGWSFSLLKDSCKQLLKTPEGKRLEIAEIVCAFCSYMSISEAFSLIQFFPDLSKKQAMELLPLIEKGLTSPFHFETIKSFIKLALLHDKLQEMVQLILLCSYLQKNIINLQVFGLLKCFLHNRGADEMIDTLPMLIEVFSLHSYKDLDVRAKTQLAPLVYKLCQKKYLSKQEKMILFEMLAPIGCGILQKYNGPYLSNASSVYLSELSWTEKQEDAWGSSETTHHNAVEEGVAAIAGILDKDLPFSNLKYLLDFFKCCYPPWIEIYEPPFEPFIT
jgi:hypothetical protein